jgi:hypothetical protein
VPIGGVTFDTRSPAPGKIENAPQVHGATFRERKFLHTYCKHHKIARYILFQYLIKKIGAPAHRCFFSATGNKMRTIGFSVSEFLPILTRLADLEQIPPECTQLPPKIYKATKLIFYDPCPVTVNSVNIFCIVHLFVRLYSYISRFTQLKCQLKPCFNFDFQNWCRGANFSASYQLSIESKYVAKFNAKTASRCQANGQVMFCRHPEYPVSRLEPVNWKSLLQNGHV